MLPVESKPVPTPSAKKGLKEHLTAKEAAKAAEDSVVAVDDAGVANGESSAAAAEVGTKSVDGKTTDAAEGDGSAGDTGAAVVMNKAGADSVKKTDEQVGEGDGNENAEKGKAEESGDDVGVSTADISHGEGDSALVVSTNGKKTNGGNVVVVTAAVAAGEKKDKEMSDVEVYKRDMGWLRSAHGMVAEVGVLLY